MTAALSLFCLFEAPDPTDPTRKVCRQCGRSIRTTQAADRISSECPAADAIRPAYPWRTGPRRDLFAMLVARARRAWPECPLSDAELRELADRCKTCARYDQRAGRCGRWSCATCWAKWGEALALGATCYEAAPAN